jgi:hypothetical protein
VLRATRGLSSGVARGFGSEGVESEEMLKGGRRAHQSTNRELVAARSALTVHRTYKTAHHSSLTGVVSSEAFVWYISSTADR